MHDVLVEEKSLLWIMNLGRTLTEQYIKCLKKSFGQKYIVTWYDKHFLLQINENLNAKENTAAYTENTLQDNPWCKWWCYVVLYCVLIWWCGMQSIAAWVTYVSRPRRERGGPLGNQHIISTSNHLSSQSSSSSEVYHDRTFRF